MAPDSFKGKVVIITGASYGIGKAIALRLSAEGADTVLAARSRELLEEVAGECRSRGARSIAAVTDVAEDADCAALVERTIAEFGRIDMLVNDAGFAATAKFTDFADLSLFRRVMEVNFFGAVRCTHLALPHLISSEGRIVNISSLGGIFALPWNSAYNASKFALHGFSESLRMDLAETGVSVTVICPYWVVSKFHEHMVDAEGRAKGPEGSRIYNEKMMTSDECARIVVEAARRRKREVLMSHARHMAVFKAMFPGLIDRRIIAELRRSLSTRKG